MVIYAQRFSVFNVQSTKNPTFHKTTFKKFLRMSARDSSAPSSSRSESLERIKKIQATYLSGSMEIREFMEGINGCTFDCADTYLAAVGAVMGLMAYSKSSPHKFTRYLARFIGKVLRSDDEIVRRSCLPLISLFTDNAKFKDLIAQLVKHFEDWGIRAQETMLSFAFSFNAKVVLQFKPFEPHAEACVASKDELLAAAAEDFLLYLHESEGKPKETDDPRFRMSMDFGKSFRAAAALKQKLEEARELDPGPSESESLRPEFSDDFEPPEAEYKIDFDDGVDWENAEPPMTGGSKLMMSIKPSGNNDFSAPKKLTEEPRAKPPPKPKTAQVSAARDRMETSLPPETPKKLAAKREETLSTSGGTPKTIPRSKQASRGRQSSLPSSAEETPSKKPKKAPPPPSVPDLVQMMRDKDWEKQQESVDYMNEILQTNPALLAPSCKEIWLNLIDLVTCARTILSNSSLQFANVFYEQFAAQLAPHSAQFIQTLLGLSCSKHQFLADGASAVLLTIADKGPRNRVFKSFMVGAKHKNPIARGRSVQCMTILLEAEPATDDNEFQTIVKTIAPLVRDTKSECREAAKRALKSLSSDERFWPMARRIISNTQEFNDMKRMIE